MKKLVIYSFIAAFSLAGFQSCDKAAATEETAAAEIPAETVAVTETQNSPESAPAAASSEETGEVVKAAPAFYFEKVSHDFGDIQQGDVVSETFKFKNVGDADLVISDIKVTCGCTTPEYTKNPVAPGTEGSITLQFNSRGKMGAQHKPVTVYSNIEGGSTELVIRANILQKTESEGPFKKQ